MNDRITDKSHHPSPPPQRGRLTWRALLGRWPTAAADAQAGGEWLGWDGWVSVGHDVGQEVSDA